MPTEQEQELFNKINGTVTSGPAVVNPSAEQMFDKINAGSKYEAIQNNNIAVDSGNVAGIENEAQAMAYAGTLGFTDTYRGVKQLFNIDEEQMAIDQKKLNSIFRNKEYGGKALATYMGGIIADPAGWIIPVAKAKSVASMVKQGIAYGTGIGAASYVDQDMGFSRLEQAGIGAVGGGVITGALGLAGKKWFGFDALPKTTDDALEKLPSKNLQIEQTRIKNIRRQEAEVSRVMSDGLIDEKLTLMESYRKNAMKPVWDKWVQNPISPFFGVAAGAAAYHILDEYNETETAQQFLFNGFAIGASYYLGKRFIGNPLNKNEWFNTKMHKQYPENRMSPDMLRLDRELDGRVLEYKQKIGEITEELDKLGPEERRVAYNLMGGDLGVDELKAMSKGELVERLVVSKGINPETGVKYTAKELKGLSKAQQKKLLEKETRKQERAEDYLGGYKVIDGKAIDTPLKVPVPADVEKIIALTKDQAKIMKEIAEDMRLSGLLDDDIFKTNINNYIKRNYETIVKEKGFTKATTWVKNLSNIRGDSTFARGSKYILGESDTFTLAGLKKILPKLRAERQYDYRINKLYGQKKDGYNRLVNRIDDEADPQYNKALSADNQASNYGVIIRKAKKDGKEIKGRYEIITQLSKKERLELGELDDAALQLAKTAQELKSTIGIGKFYATLNDFGIKQGWVLDKGALTSKIFARKGLVVSEKTGIDGQPIVSSIKTRDIEIQMSNLRYGDPTLPPPAAGYAPNAGQPLPEFPFGGQVQYQKLKKELAKEQAIAKKEARKIEREAKDKFNMKNATPEKPVKIEVTDANGKVLKDNNGEAITEKYVYVPDSKQKDYGGKDGTLAVIKFGEKQDKVVAMYGKLAGKLVKLDQYKDMMLLKKMRDDDGNRVFGETYFKINSLWKKTKTVYNPAVHTNNYVSNFTLFYGAGGSWRQLLKVHKDGTARQILNFEKGTLKWDDLHPDLQHMYRSGVFGRDYLSAELNNSLNLTRLSKTFDVSDAEKSGDFMGSALKTAKNIIEDSKLLKTIKQKGKAADEAVSGLYQLEDRLFRVALYRSRLNELNPSTNLRWTPSDASGEAVKWFVDYNIKSEFINNLRGTGVPFLSYSYRVMPLLAEIAVKHPEKVAVIAALGYAANDLGRAGTGTTKHQQEQERKFMQEYNKTNMFGFAAMPQANIKISGTGKDSKYINIGRMLPGADVFNMGGTTPNALPFVPTALSFGGPAISTVLNVFGVDPFMGNKRDAEEFGMNPGEVAASRATNIAKDFIPNLPYVPEALGGSHSYKKIKRAYEREYGDEPKYNTLDDPLTTGQAIASSLGFKINTADTSRLRRFGSAEAKRLKSTFDQARKKINNSRMKSEITLEEYRDAIDDLKQSFLEQFDAIKERE